MFRLNLKTTTTSGGKPGSTSDLHWSSDDDDDEEEDDVEEEVKEENVIDAIAKAQREFEAQKNAFTQALAKKQIMKQQQTEQMVNKILSIGVIVYI